MPVADVPVLKLVAPTPSPGSELNVSIYGAAPAASGKAINSPSAIAIRITHRDLAPFLRTSRLSIRASLQGIATGSIRMPNLQCTMAQRPTMSY